VRYAWAASKWLACRLPVLGLYWQPGKWPTTWWRAAPSAQTDRKLTPRNFSHTVTPAIHSFVCLKVNSRRQRGGAAAASCTHEGRWQWHGHCMTVATRRAVAAGEELTVSYLTKEYDTYVGRHDVLPVPVRSNHGFTLHLCPRTSGTRRPGPAARTTMMKAASCGTTPHAAPCHWARYRRDAST